MIPLDHDGCWHLADALPDAPDSVIAIHALRTGRCRAYRIPGRARPLQAAVVDPMLTPGELIAFGHDPHALAALAAQLTGWSCLEVPQLMAPQVATALERLTGRPSTHAPDVFYTLPTSARLRPHPAVRLLTVHDADLYAASAPFFGDDPSAAQAALLEGPVAAAIVDGRVVAAVEANVRSARHANLTAETLPEYRGLGYCTAAASLAARAVQTMGLAPVWSAGEGNAPSRRVAEKLGFVEVARWIYLIPRHD